MNAITSWASAASNVPSSHGSCSAGGGAAAAPGGGPPGAAGAGAGGGGRALAARVGELRGGIDRGDPLRPGARDELAREPARAAAHVERARSRPDLRRVGERHGEGGRVAAHEAVVVLGGRDELHRPTQPGAWRPVKLAHAHAPAATGSGRTTTVSATGTTSSAAITEAAACARIASGLSAS